MDNHPAALSDENLTVAVVTQHFLVLQESAYIHPKIKRPYTQRTPVT